MNLPSIVTNISGCNEIIENNKNGILISLRSVEELEKVMYNVLENKNLIMQMKENARKIIYDKFDKDIVWNALLEEYGKIFQNAHK